jgi:sodium-dependent phosphate cotransporter
MGVSAALFFLYFFLFALELLGNSAKVLGGCSAGGLLSDETNPVASLVIGALATALVQSSSTTTSIVVTLVGAEAVSVKSGIYLIMGANIGTSVTNTIVAMGQMGSDDQLERAFSGATVHDLFNLLAVAVLFPVELVTGYLYHLTGAILPDSVAKGDKWEGPLKKIVSPLASRVLKANKGVIKDVATKKVESCAYYYPVTCVDGIEDYKHCASSCDKDAGESFDDGDCGRVGLITCDKNSGSCPFFF